MAAYDHRLSWANHQDYRSNSTTSPLQTAHHELTSIHSLTLLQLSAPGLSKLMTEASTELVLRLIHETGKCLSANNQNVGPSCRAEIMSRLVALHQFHVIRTLQNASEAIESAEAELAFAQEGLTQPDDDARVAQDFAAALQRQGLSRGDISRRQNFESLPVKWDSIYEDAFLRWKQRRDLNRNRTEPEDDIHAALSDLSTIFLQGDSTHYATATDLAQLSARSIVLRTRGHHRRHTCTIAPGTYNEEDTSSTDEHVASLRHRDFEQARIFSGSGNGASIPHAEDLLFQSSDEIIAEVRQLCGHAYTAATQSASAWCAMGISRMWAWKR